MADENPYNEIDFDEIGDGLNAKKKVFCQEWIKDLNGTQAYIRCGFTKGIDPESAAVMASKWLSQDNVKKYIQRLMDQRSRRTDITADYVLAKIQETIERSMGGVAVYDKFGNQVFIEGKDGKMAALFGHDSKAALKGCELLGKHLKILTESIEIKDQTKRVPVSELPKNDPEAAKRMLDDVKSGKIELVES